MLQRDAKITFGVLVYEGVEPIDIGGTTGVLSMARRILPNIADLVLASRAGRVRLAGGLEIFARYGVDDAPSCDIVIVCGGPGWPEASRDPALLRFLQAREPTHVASVCTGALILGAAGLLDGRVATTRRRAVGGETHTPLAILSSTAPTAHVREAVVVDDGVVTGGGVSLAIDATLYLIQRFYGAEAAHEVAEIIEYDRARAANRLALGAVATTACSSMPA